MRTTTFVTFAELRFLIVLLACACLTLPAGAAGEANTGQPHLYGPVTKSESLKSITQRIIGDRDLDLRDTMAEIYYANPDAFVSGRSNILLPDVMLSIPEHLQWNIPSNVTEADTAATETLDPVAGKQAEPADTLPTEQATIDEEAAEDADATGTPGVAAAPKQADEMTQIELQQMKREVLTLRKALDKNREQQAMTDRLQGAVYLIILVAFIVAMLLVAQRMLKQKGVRPTPPFTLPPTTETAPATRPVRSPTADTGDKRGQPVSPDSTGSPALTPDMDDVTPASPMAALDDMTPVRPLAAYEDHPREDHGDLRPAADLQETIHELSGHFKDMLEDKDASNLALARVYMNLGDYEQAKPLLAAVHRSATSEYVQQADEMIQELLQAQIFAASFNMIMEDVPDDSSSTVSRKLEKLSLNRDSLDSLSDSFLTQQQTAHEDARYEYDVAQRFFSSGNYQQSKHHLARILSFRGPDLKADAYDLLKRIEQNEPRDDDLTMKSPALPDNMGDQPMKKVIQSSSITYSREQLDRLSGQFMAISGDALKTRLALANMHLELEDFDRAAGLCHEIMAGDDGEYAAAAHTLLIKIDNTRGA